MLAGHRGCRGGDRGRSLPADVSAGVPALCNRLLLFQVTCTLLLLADPESPSPTLTLALPFGAVVGPLPHGGLLGPTNPGDPAQVIMMTTETDRAPSSAPSQHDGAVPGL